MNASTNGGGNGNFGIQDQRTAIAWTKAHIAAFGALFLPDGFSILVSFTSCFGHFSVKLRIFNIDYTLNKWKLSQTVRETTVHFWNGQVAMVMTSPSSERVPVATL